MAKAESRTQIQIISSIPINVQSSIILTPIKKFKKNENKKLHLDYID